MSDKMNYARSIRNLATLYREMEGAAEALEKLGSIEQAQTEAQAKLDKLRDQGSELAAAYKQDVDKHAALKIQMAEEAEQRKKASLDIAKKVQREAEETAAETIKVAQDKAAAIMAESAADKAAASAELAGLKIEQDKLKDEISSLLIVKEDTEGAVAKLRAHLEDLKSKLGAL